MKRREFLKLSGCFIAAASISGLPGCGDNSEEGTKGEFSFAEGVASGDPRASSVMLWTRVQRSDGESSEISVRLQVATDEAFSSIVVEKEVVATQDSDHTLRVLIIELEVATTYYYRFTAGVDEVVGRTRTAPAESDDAPVRLAWVSCQDYGAGSYGAYRQLLNEDKAAAEDKKVQVVIHLGDFIYETIGGAFQVPLDEDLRPIELKDFSGKVRSIEAFPSGGGVDGNVRYAQTLEDYRHLYKQYLRDPDLRAARAQWPFIQTWDDHEFSDDCWQSQANYDSTSTSEEASQKRRVAANQAWFEFIPVNLEEAEGVPGVANPAKDFVFADVEDVNYSVVDDDNFGDEANNRAAIASITIYRSLRYGKNIDFVVTDLRSYRSDHSIAEDLTFNNGAFFHPRTALPKEVVRIMDEGKTANGGNPPNTVEALPNTRKDSPVGTMLGAAQKTWWKQTMEGSTATWKVWCNEMPMMRFDVPKADSPVLLFDRIAFCDAWDDKPTERKELMTFLKDKDIGNVVVLTGDMHAHFAGTLMDDYDAASPVPVATEFVAAGISSNSVFSFFESAVRSQPQPLKDLITFDDTQFGGTLKLQNNLNTLLRYGANAAIAGATSGSIDDIEAARDATVNPHLVFADCNAQGYGLMDVSSAGVETTLVTINRPIVDTGEAGPGILGTATFQVDVDDPASLSGPVLSGTKPFPMR